MSDLAAPIHVPLRERINFRILIFAAVVLLIVGYPAYLYIESELTGGIKDIGGGYKEVDLKAMSTFNFDQVSGTIDDIPAKWRALDGQKVVLYGEIAPTTFASRALNEFDLVYSVTKCCFSGPPQVQHFVQARMKDGREAPYYSGLVRVRGTLHVNVIPGEGRVASVYQLDVEDIEPVM
ncbi:hypothetical protein [Fontivita pretiosa]|uniref:hypothetical protein n=1 Tax=Fontivita pretiosa TaxID=2989684 RepID=UPI003D1718FE